VTSKKIELVSVQGPPIDNIDYIELNIGCKLKELGIHDDHLKYIRSLTRDQVDNLIAAIYITCWLENGRGEITEIS